MLPCVSALAAKTELNPVTEDRRCMPSVLTAKLQGAYLKASFIIKVVRLATIYSCVGLFLAYR